jgi:hypothetical protein
VKVYVETVQYIVKGDADYYREVLHLANALLIVGARDQVVAMLLEMFVQTLDATAKDTAAGAAASQRYLQPRIEV